MILSIISAIGKNNEIGTLQFREQLRHVILNGALAGRFEPAGKAPGAVMDLSMREKNGFGLRTNLARSLKERLDHHVRVPSFREGTSVEYCDLHIQPPALSLLIKTFPRLGSSAFLRNLFS